MAVPKAEVDLETTARPVRLKTSSTSAPGPQQWVKRFLEAQWFGVQGSGLKVLGYIFSLLRISHSMVRRCYILDHCSFVRTGSS